MLTLSVSDAGEEYYVVDQVFAAIVKRGKVFKHEFY